MGKLFLLVLAIVVGYMFYQSIPDIQRYLAIRSM